MAASLTTIPSGINTSIAAFPTTEETALTLLQYLYAITGTITDFNIGSVIRTLAESIGSVDEIEGIAIQALAFQALVYSAYAAFGITPILAAPSVGTVTFTTVGNIPLPPNLNVIIPPNTILQTSGGIQFTTPPNISVIMVSGTSSVNSPVQSITTGLSTNVPAGAINQLLTGLNYSLTVSNQLPTTGGLTAETPTQTQTRFLNYVSSLGLCSPIAVAASVIGVNFNGEYVKYSDCYENWIQQVLNNQTPFPGFTCYDDQTELLTECGWIKFSDINENIISRVATLNSITHELEYQDIEYFHCYDYNGKLIKIYSDGYDLAVTPDHLLYTCKDHHYDETDPNNWNLKPALEIGKSRRLKLNAKWLGNDSIEFYEIQAVINSNFISHKIPIETWLEFLGFFLSEGSTADYSGEDHQDNKGIYRHRRITISQRDDNAQVKSRMEESLNKLPFKFFKSFDGFVCNSKELYEEVVHFGLSYKKYVPDFVKTLSSRLIKIFLDALMLGDGTKNYENGIYDGTYCNYTTTSPKLADDIQELLLKIGWAGLVNCNKEIVGKTTVIFDKSKNRYYEITSKHPIYTTTVRKKSLCPEMYSGKRELIDYTGKVYCVTVPNHIIYIRRNGKPVWCGNCYIDNGSGTASTNLINAVSQYLSTGGAAGFRPAGVPYSVVAVTPVIANVLIIATSINPSFITTIQTAVTQAVNAYFSSLLFGTPAQLTQLTAAVANVTFGDVSNLSVSLLNASNVSVPSIIPTTVQRVILKVATISIT
jgi:intein/homing endonuclease/uncharacterized phage protein gp47/JayE